MEAIGAIFLIYIVVGILRGIVDLFSGGGSGGSVQPLQIKTVWEYGKNGDPGLHRIQLIGRIPVYRKTNLMADIYIYDSQTKLPFLSNFNEMMESPSSRVYCHRINVGTYNADQYFPNWVNLSAVIKEAVCPPHKGSRNAEIAAYFYDQYNPPMIVNGVPPADKTILGYCQAVVTLAYDEFGYIDLNKNIEKALPIMVEIGMATALVDGSLADAEGAVIKQWIKKQIDYEPQSNKEKMKSLLNKALEDNYRKYSILNKPIDKALLQNLASLTNENLKLDLIQLLYDILSADGVADDAELKIIKEVSSELGLSYDKIEKIREKSYLKLDTSSVASEQGHTTTDESLFNIQDSDSIETKLSVINKEFKKWNSRINSLKAGTERDNAQRMIDALGRLRKKYGSQ